MLLESLLFDGCDGAAHELELLVHRGEGREHLLLTDLLRSACLELGSLTREDPLEVMFRGRTRLVCPFGSSARAGKLGCELLALRRAAHRGDGVADDEAEEEPDGEEKKVHMSTLAGATDISGEGGRRGECRRAFPLLIEFDPLDGDVTARGQ
ncbi:hypothetical protein GCM10027427_09280 [Pseudoclavibacter terrae]